MLIQKQCVYASVNSSDTYYVALLLCRHVRAMQAIRTLCLHIMRTCTLPFSDCDTDMELLMKNHENIKLGPATFRDHLHTLLMVRANQIIYCSIETYIHAITNV